MSKPARSIFLFGIYLVVLGVTLVAVPNLLLSLFGFAETREVWIRVVGMLVLFLGAYDVQAARQEWDGFIRLSVLLRVSVPAFFGAFVLAGLAPPVLLLFAAADFAAAVWTWLALREAHHPAIA